METIFFVDPESGDKVEFCVEETLRLNEVNYLLVSEQGGDDEAEAYIMKEVQSDENESTYEMVEDEVEFDAVAKLFAEMLDEDVDLEY